MLECRNITKKYGSKTAVNSISMQIEPGRIYALLGPNGSGKTTLMKMAIGLVKPTEGDFYYKNERINAKSRSKIAYMSTEPYFYPWMTADDVGKYYQDFFGDFSMEKYENLLSRMQLDKKMKTKSLSSGVMAKLKVAVTMARKASVYLLDEPLNGIDLLARDQIISSIIEAADEENSIVISSHLVDELEKIIDTAVFIKDGQLIRTCQVEDVRFAEGRSIADEYRTIYGQGGTESWED